MTSAMSVHPTALVSEGAELAADVEIGPYTIVGPRVRLGDGCVLHSHVVVEGDTWLGPECEVWPQAVLGSPPQHRHDNPEGPQGKLRIGARNRFREGVTVNVGSSSGHGVTTLGDDNMMLAHAHVGHDATLGNQVVMTNAAMLAGHTSVGDNVVAGAMVGLHQFARVGRLTMLAGGAKVSQDAPPFALVHGDRARIRGVNVIGLHRAGMTDDEIAIIKRAYRSLFWRHDSVESRIERVRADAGDHPLVREILAFMASTTRGVIMARGSAADLAEEQE